jgi:hypothetical protein
MALPTRVMDCEEVYAEAITSYKNMWFVFRIQECPAEFETDGKPGHWPKQAVQESVVITCPTSENLEVNWYVTSRHSEDFTSTYSSDISTPTFQTIDTTSDYTSGHSNTSSQMQGKTRYLSVRCKYKIGSTASTVGKIHSVIVESIFGDHYSGNDTSTNKMDFAEMLSADLVHTPDRSCSAWHVKNLLAQSYNKLLEENRTFYSVPCIDYEAV